jgi:2'-5' RNA ligase
MLAASTAEPLYARPQVVRSCETDTYDPVYALVSYVPDPLGKFLDDLRRELVPTCYLVSHVTFLPPRPISTTPERAFDQIRDQVPQFQPFELELGGVRVFDVTGVVYLELAGGAERLIEIHDRMNWGLLGYQEPWPFHPHMTLAQNFDRSLLDAKRELAERRWSEWNGPKKFLIDKLCFVQRTNCQNWASLACCSL